MANDLDKISRAFQMLGGVCFPDGFLAELELAAVTAHLQATKPARAEHLLATRGPDAAAVMLGCSRGHVYRLAEESRKMRRAEDAAA